MTITDRLGNVPEGLGVKTPVIAATTGSNIVLSGLQTIDGVALAANQRVLIKDQTDATQNGIYQASTGPWTRPNDANNTESFIAGTQVFVAQGALNAGFLFEVTTTDDPIVIGASLIAFAQVKRVGNDASTLTFTGPWTGAQTRFISDKLADALNVMDFIPPSQHAAITNGTTTYDATAAIQAAIDAAAGSWVMLPAGTFIITSQLHYSTAASAIFVAGLRLRGSGQEVTFIDNRVANNSAIISQSTLANKFQLGGEIRDLTIKTTTSPASSHGIELKAVYQFKIANVHVIGLSGDGMRVTSVLGDADASNVVLFDTCRLENCNIGINCNFSLGITQPSFLRVDNCFFSGNTTAGYRFIGLQGVMINSGFVLNGIGLWMPYNNSENAQFCGVANSFENNGTPHIRIDSLQGGEFVATEIASTVTACSAGIHLAADGGSGHVQGCRLEGTRVRIGATFNPYTLFTLGANASINTLSNTFWQSYDATGQSRYSVDPSAFGNRVSDTFDAIQIGSGAGVISLPLVNGRNDNVALPLDGAGFLISGPSGVFQISGLANGFDGRKLELHNNSGQTLTLNAEDTNSTAANRIHTDSLSNVTINNAGTANLRYFAGISRWVLTGHG